MRLTLQIKTFRNFEAYLLNIIDYEFRNINIYKYYIYN